MKNKMLLVGLLSLNAAASEKEAQFKEFIGWRDLQGLIILCSMGAVGFKALAQNSDEICASDPFCWKVAVPALTTSVVIGGSWIYKRLKS